MAKDVKLKVAEAIQDDVNKGIVRIDTGYLKQIDVRPGSIIEIKGERSTVGIADRALPGDMGLNIIRTDPLIRRNAKTSIGEFVTIKKADVKEAKSVTIAPAREGLMVRANPDVFKQGLLGRAVIKGDIVSLGGSQRRRNTMVGHPFFDEMFSMMNETTMGLGLGDLKFVVVNCEPKQAVLITENTNVVFNPKAVEVLEEKAIDVTYEDIGGLDEELKKVREMIELPLKHPEIFERLGIEAPKGVLLHGSPGTGKTLLAKAVANETNANFILINGPEIMSKYYGQSEENLRKKFEEAEKNAPSIIFIDEIDAIASKREESKGEVEKRVVAQLLAIMDGLQARGKVIVIAATNIPNVLDPALRRPGRFDREIEIGVPNVQGRLTVLKIHTRNMPLEPNFDLSQAKFGLEQKINSLIQDIISLSSKNSNTDEDVKQLIKGKKSEQDNLRKSLEKISRIKQADFANFMASSDVSVLSPDDKSLLEGILREDMLTKIASITHGFVGADLASLAREAAMTVLRRVLGDTPLKEGEPIPKEILEKLVLSQSDFKEALKVVRPSALREVLIEVPNVKWNDIGGLEEIKQELKEAVEWPLKHKADFRRMGVKPPKGVLLYGAPGTGKTLLAKAVANESEANFILVKGPEMLSKWVGESEKAVRKIFEKARQTSPTIIFFDEIDSIAPRRGLSNEDSHVTERVVNQLLTEMDGLEDMNDIIIIGATNRPDIMDTALLRPGRFDRIILTPVPEVKGRKEIFKVHTNGMPLEKDVNVDELVKQTDGYVGADIESVCREAAIFALREDMKAKSIKMKHFELALAKVRPSATKDVAEAYADLEKTFRAARGKEMKDQRPSYYG
ncbi:CDC48 family AAA ATPase [Candidatus Woesearchaeota archaeon]|nr:CDC48 family AAA ATPase [Candidatus Woesearchaeota archaeon]